MESNTESRRAGNFSSSSIWKLMKRAKNGIDFGAPALTYISEKRMERRLGRELQNDISSRPTSWGNLLEKRVFDLLPLDYKLESKTRYVHPSIPYWNGMPDLVHEVKVGDIKAPNTLKAFCELVDSFEGGVEAFKERSPEYFWQLVSNAILTGKDIAEIVVYVPYLKELVEIRDSAGMFDGDQNQVAWINWAGDSSLPYLLEGRHYKNLNIFPFNVPKKDIIELTDSVERAGKLLLA